MVTWRGLLKGLVMMAAAVSFIPSVIVARDDPTGSVPGLVLQAVTAVAGILLLRVPEHRHDGWWLLAATTAVGVTFFFSTPMFAWGYWNQVGWSFYYAVVPCLVGPVLRLPDQPAPPRTVRRLVLGFWIVLVGLWAGSGLFWDPVTMKGYTGPDRWLTLYPWQIVGWGVPRLVPILLVPLAAWFSVEQVRRYRHAAGPNRTAVRVLAVLTLLMAWGLVVRVAVGSYDPLMGLWNTASLVHNAFSAAAIILVLLVAIAANLHRAGFLDALLSAGGHAPEIESVLASYVHDPTLRLRFRTDDGWTGATGTPVGPSPSPGRRFHPIVVEPDGPVVEADLDTAVDPTSKAVGPLLDAAGVVLARARLSVQQAAQAIELRASRARIVAAGVEQRRQLERDLHDGAQQHLLAAQAALARAELGGEPEEVSAAIAFAQSRLSTTMAELRGLARGQHPALLSQAGLASALGSLVQLSDRVQVHVAPELVGRRFAPVVEATAWFVASEGVVNALKHTDAGVSVEADVSDLLRVVVTDTGDGGADFVPDGGLAGLRDRVRAAGGTLQLDSPAGGGTTLTATLPARPDEEVT